MSEDAREEVRGRVVALLETLARDQAARVRAAVSDAVKDLDCVPKAMVGELARDAVLAVAEPVLRFSPLLGEDELLAIITGAHADGALAAIAGRDRLGGRAAAAIADAGDEAAVAVLLANPSAQVREETLDLIVQRAPGRPRWHAPLVERPTLPARLAARIAAFVADALLRRLQAREDLSQEARAAVAGALRQRLAAAAPAEPESAPAEPPEAEVKRLKREGKLDDEAVWAGLEAGRRDFVAAALAELAGLDPGIVARILAAHSPKGVVALAWKAGLGPRTALQVQLRVAGISPRAAVGPKSGGAWPLTPDEMTWHLEFFGG
jgi:uncharacterized protein (DUF2336 family)